MVHLVALFKAAQNGNAVLYCRLIHQHRLEASLQCSIFFNVFAVLVKSSGADAVQLAPGKQGLQKIACVHAALGFACAHNGVQLVNEENYSALRAANLLKHSLEPLLKLATVLGPGYKCTHIKGKYGFVLKPLRHITPDYSLGKALGNGCFTNAGLTDKNRVILGFAGEYADYVADFAVSADNRVQLVFTGALNKVGAVFLQCIKAGLRIVPGDWGGFYLGKLRGKIGAVNAVVGKYAFYP